MIARRAFLGHLAKLPLIGGGVAILGAPTAAAEPVTVDLLEAYKTWLDHEQRFLAWEMADMPAVRARYAPLSLPEGVTPVGGPNADRLAYYQTIRGCLNYVGDAGHYHHGPQDAGPSSRAAIVLSAVGCDWRQYRV